jgi:hypothetical protein
VPEMEDAIAEEENVAKKKPKTILIPFVMNIVPVVDIVNKRIEITPPMVEEYNNGEAFEVEFCDNNGQTYALVSLESEKLILLYSDTSNLSLVC